MRSARPKRKKTKFLKSIKTFFIYSFISIVVLGFFLNTFVSNILEYSFALANTGGFVDLKTDEKYSVALISGNKLQEVKEINVYHYDKKNRKVTAHPLNLDLPIFVDSNEHSLKELIRLTKGNSEAINQVLSANLGLRLAFTQVESSDNYLLLKKLLSGTGSIFDLYEAQKLDGISLRDLYFIYSFSGSIDRKDYREDKINNLDQFDREVRDFNIDSILGEGGLSITILNASNTTGLARNFSRIVTNLGGRVVDIGNTDSPSNESFIVYKERTPSLDYLQSHLQIAKSLSMEEVGLKYPEIIKSDLVIVLGVDKVE